MKLILMAGRGKNKSDVFAMVDDEDFEAINKHKWHKMINGKHLYVCRAIVTNGKVLQVSMHREILGLSKTDKVIVDHRDGNGLNNQRSNLRACNHSENAKNRKARGTSKYLGVSWHVYKWKAQIKANGKYIHLGMFEDEVLAAASYNEAAIKYHGAFARLNKIA